MHVRKKFGIAIIDAGTIDAGIIDAELLMSIFWCQSLLMPVTIDAHEAFLMPVTFDARHKSSTIKKQNPKMLCKTLKGWAVLEYFKLRSVQV